VVRADATAACGWTPPPAEDAALRPLVRALDGVPAGLCGTAALLGCGRSALLPALVARFRRVLAIDGSPAALAAARDACRVPRVTFHRADLADLSAFRGSVDVAVTSHPAVAPDAAPVFAALHASLRSGGRLLGVFPATESQLYRGFLRAERERDRRREASAGAGRPDVDAARERHFYGFELRHRLRHAGFTRVRLDRVCHPWEAFGDADRFPGEPPGWAWLVQAVVPARDG
jgi:SAM-dependent methyltransferase